MNDAPAPETGPPLALRPELSATPSLRAFELNPDLPIDGIPREIYLRLSQDQLRSTRTATTLD